MPKEFEEPLTSIEPRDEHVFFEAYDPNALAAGFAERFVKLMPAAARDAMGAFAPCAHA